MLSKSTLYEPFGNILLRRREKIVLWFFQKDVTMIGLDVSLINRFAFICSFIIIKTKFLYHLYHEKSVLSHQYDFSSRTVPGK